MDLDVYKVVHGEVREVLLVKVVVDDQEDDLVVLKQVKGVQLQVVLELEKVLLVEQD